MSELEVLSLLREALRATALMALPLLLSALAVGVAIGLLQALTSVQELTLTFVPKILVMMAVFSLTAGFMASTLLKLFEGRVLPIISG